MYVFNMSVLRRYWRENTEIHGIWTDIAESESEKDIRRIFAKGKYRFIRYSPFCNVRLDYIILIFFAVM